MCRLSSDPASMSGVVRLFASSCLGPACAVSVSWLPAGAVRSSTLGPAVRSRSWPGVGRVSSRVAPLWTRSACRPFSGFAGCRLWLRWTPFRLVWAPVSAHCRSAVDFVCALAWSRFDALWAPLETLRERCFAPFGPLGPCRGRVGRFVTLLKLLGAVSVPFWKARDAPVKPVVAAP